MNHARIVGVIALAAIAAHLYLGAASGSHREHAAGLGAHGGIALSVGRLTWALANSGWFPTRRPVYRGGILILIAALLLALGAWRNALRLWLL